jgi:hypothetical protein
VFCWIQITMQRIIQSIRWESLIIKVNIKILKSLKLVKVKESHRTELILTLSLNCKLSFTLTISAVCSLEIQTYFQNSEALENDRVTYSNRLIPWVMWSPRWSALDPERMAGKPTLQRDTGMVNTASILCWLQQPTQRADVRIIQR